eukprot:gnl/MRDRNA2_/MRDRNA2_87476_c0_seq1.p1 gnl/MRDRNA2_/MRDRNA2_87476_c0~~gnl/MRDRNA2_/MRDRNA2_87476_c0_seq1.p1  ORF type:complete len:421 (+),score=74.95 gnl/MRDRNA2_/MRDRNA2_87476_c0_seq1:96-1358(+)
MSRFASFPKLGANFSFDWFGKQTSKSLGGYNQENQPLSQQQSSPEGTQLATYVVPASAAVILSRTSEVRKIADLKPGDKILSVDVAAGNRLIWGSLQDVQALPDSSVVPNAIVVGFGNERTSLEADQCVLAMDRKRKMVMKLIRRLEIGFDALVVFHEHSLRWQGKNATTLKKVTSRALVRNADEGLYKITLGSTSHCLLMSCNQDSKHFFAVNPLNSTVPALKIDPKAAQETVEIKNTFIEIKAPNAKLEEGDGEGSIQRSYSDSDIHRLAKEYDEQEVGSRGLFDDVVMADTSTNSSKSQTTTSCSAKSEHSSLSNGSISEVRVGTEVVIDVDGQPRSKSSSVMRFSEYSQLPFNDFGNRLSAASATHLPGRRFAKCRKCAFHNAASLKKGKSCKNGALCDFCHESHERFIHVKGRAK